MRRASVLLAFLLTATAADAVAAEIPGAILTLEVEPASLPAGQYRDALPPRFVLLEKGVVFVGGTTQVFEGRLEPAEAKALEAQLEAVRRLKGLASPVRLGAAAPSHRLVAPPRKFQLVATGDPAGAPPALAPLGQLLSALAAFEHWSLRPYRPAAFALRVREEALPGGCRAWKLPFPPTEALDAARSVPASGLPDWPTGAVAASVCAGEKRYAVTLRPLLPGERP